MPRVGPPLSRDRILATAVRIADAEGLGAVTMRRLAAELDIEAMSLYHHLPGKQGLLDGLVEQVIAEIADQIAGIGTDLPWQAEVRARCLAARVVMLAHPWAPGLVSSRAQVPFGAYRLFDELLAAMLRGGLSYHLGHRAMHALGSMVLGFAQEVFSPSSGLDTDATDAEFAALADAVPHLAAMAAAEFHPATDPNLGWCDSQAEFEFTLDLLLDGLARAQS